MLILFTADDICQGHHRHRRHNRHRHQRQSYRCVFYRIKH